MDKNEVQQESENREVEEARKLVPIAPSIRVARIFHHPGHLQGESFNLTPLL